MRTLIRFVALSLIFCCSILTSITGRNLEEVKKSGVIRIALTKTDFNTINYPLAVEFARYLNVKLELITISWEEAFQINGVIPDDVITNRDIAYTPDIFREADAIFSTFTILDWRKKLFDFAETLLSAELIIISKQSEPPKSLDDLKGKTIALMKGTSFEARIAEINKRIEGNITLILTEDSETAKQQLVDGKAWGVVLDADEALNFMSTTKNQYTIGIPINPISKTAYAIEKGNPLGKEIESFFETITSNGVLDRIFNEKFNMTYSSYTKQISENAQLKPLIRDLDKILESKKIVVALRDRSFIYREGGQKQFMHALAEEFADYLGVQMEFILTPYFAKYWETSDGKIIKDSVYTPDWFNYFDLACEVIVPLDWRTSKVDLISVYPSEYSVIGRKNTRINSIKDMKNLYAVTNIGSVYEEIFQKNGIDSFYYAPVNDFFPDIDSGKADFTIIHNAFLELPKFPELEVKFSMGTVEVCWALRKDQKELKQALEEFLDESREKGLISILHQAMINQSLTETADLISSYYESYQIGQLPSVIYSAEDGLPQEDVYSIFQDNKRYMWFGTNAGVVRYNGREMKLFNTNNGMPDNSVLDIGQDAYGLMYFATTNGIATLLNDEVVNNYLPTYSFHSIFIDKNNNKWFLGENGVYRLGTDFILTHLNDSFPELPENIYCITEDTLYHDKYIATTGGVYKYSEYTDTIANVIKENCHALSIDQNDSIWFSTREGVYIAAMDDLRHFKLNRGRIRKLNKSLDLSNNIVNEILPMNTGSTWLITDSEISQVISTDKKAIKYNKDNGLKKNKIHSFWIDLEDNIWIGYNGGLQRMTNERGLRNFYPDIINSYISSIFQDRLSRIWVASHNGLHYYSHGEVNNYSPRISKKNENLCASLLPSGNILVVSQEGLYEIDVNTLNIVQHRRFKDNIFNLQNITITKSGEIFLLTGLTGIIYYFKNFYAPVKIIENRHTGNIYQLIEMNGTIIGGNKNEIVQIDDGETFVIGEIAFNIFCVCEYENALWMGTDHGIWIFKNGILDMNNPGTDLAIKAIYPAKNKNYLWLGTNNGISYFNATKSKIEFTINSKDGLPGNEVITGSLFIDDSGLLWIGTYYGLSNFNIRAKSSSFLAPGCFIEKILLNGEPYDQTKGNVFRHYENNFVFEITGLSYSDEKSIEYEFYLRGVSNDYTLYNKGSEYKAYYNNLPPGKYEFIYRAEGKNNIWGYAEKYEFIIQNAWYQTWLFKIILFLVISMGAFAFYRIRIHAVKAQKIRLEQIVRKRTCQLEEANYELEEANHEIEAQRDQVIKQRDQILQYNKEIEDSMRAGQPLQQSMLPTEDLLKQLLPEHFVFYKPKSIVSGDFYWTTKINGKVVITAADCTGHGVQGAFMSMLGIAFLDEITNSQERLNASGILNSLRDHIIESLGQKGKEWEIKEGMDMALCIIDLEEKQLEFAGANNPLYLIRNKELFITQGDNMPVAAHVIMNPFSNHQISLEEGDVLYIFSDGYADQFGGPRGKKLMSKAMKELLIKISHLPMPDQNRMLKETIEKWMMNYEQIDDMVVIGIRI